MDPLPLKELFCGRQVYRPESDLDFPYILHLIDEEEVPTSPEHEISNWEEEIWALRSEAVSVIFPDGEPVTAPEIPTFQELLPRWTKKPLVFTHETQITSFRDTKNEFASVEEGAGVYNLWGPNNWMKTSGDRKSPLWPTPGVTTYAKSCTQTVGHVFFYIDRGEQNRESDFVLKTTIAGQNDLPLYAHLSKENPSSSTRYIGTFLAVLPGRYTVAVNDGLFNIHVTGSPFTIAVSRNYYDHYLWMKPRLFSCHGLKSWGVTYSQFSKMIYVADRDGHQISVYSASGVFQKKFGIQGSTPDTFYRPTGIAVDDTNRRLVITDKDKHRVCIYTLDGQFILTFGRKGHKDGEFQSPWGVAVSSKDSTIAIADTRNHRIQLFDCSGNFLRKYSAFETNPFEYKTELDYPRGISFDMTGENIFVADFGQHAILKFNAELTKKTNFTPKGVHLKRPQGMAIDPAGNLLVCDSVNNSIRVINWQGHLVTTIAGESMEPVHHPQDLAIMPTGDIIIVDANSEVMIL